MMPKGVDFSSPFFLFYRAPLHAHAAGIAVRLMCSHWPWHKDGKEQSPAFACLALALLPDSSEKLNLDVATSSAYEM